MPSLSTSQIYI